MSDGQSRDIEGSEEKADGERAEDKQLSEVDAAALIQTHNRVLDSWEASTDDDMRSAALEHFAATGNVPEDAGLTQDDLDTLHAGYVYQTGVEVLDHIGITAEELGQHVADEDWPTFRQMVLAGEWEALRDYARTAVVLRHEAGLPLTHQRWSRKA